MTSGALRELYVHAGLPKTGTSYLQDTLHGSRSALAADGLTLVPGRRHAHFDLALKVRGLLREYDDPRAFEVLDELAADIRACPTSRALLSHEALAPTKPAELDVLLAPAEGLEVHLVLTVRDLGRQLPSAWQQAVKGRRTHSYEEFLDAVVRREPLADDFWSNQDLLGVLGRWTTRVPPERVHVVTCPPAGTGTGVLLERFCSVVGLDPATLEVGGSTANASLGRPQAEVLARVNAALGQRLPHSRAGYRRVGRSFLSDRVLLPQGGPRAVLPGSLRGWVEETTAGWIDHLGTGGYDVVGSLEDLRTPESAYGAELEECSDGELLDVAVRALADILALRHEELDERQALRRRAAALERRVAALEARPEARLRRGLGRGLRRGGAWVRGRTTRADAGVSDR